MTPAQDQPIDTGDDDNSFLAQRNKARFAANAPAPGIGNPSTGNPTPAPTALPMPDPSGGLGGTRGLTGPDAPGVQPLPMLPVSPVTGGLQPNTDPVPSTFGGLGPTSPLTPPSAPRTDAAPQQPDPVAAAGPPSSASSGSSASSIFAADPTLPGSGYINYNGQQYRIMGTTAAGLGANGQPKPVTAQDQYFLDDGHGGQITGPNVNVDDYNNFVNGPHAPNTVYSDVSGASHPMSDLGTAKQGPLGWGKDGGPQEESYLQGGLQADAQGNATPGGYNALSDIYRQLGTTPGSVNPQVADLAKQNPNLVGALPTGGDTLARTLQSLGLAGGGSTGGTGSTAAAGGPANTSPTAGGLGKIAPPGTPVQGGSVTPGPASGITPGATASPGGPAAPGAPSTASGSGGHSTGNPVLDALLAGDRGANAPLLTKTDPNNPLTAQTIGANGVTDPVQMALSAYNTFRQSTDPQYQADLRDANRMAAAGGAIGSGSLNTSLGNIANTRQNTLATKEQELLNGALGTANDNAYRNVGIAQQQQGFQAGQQDTAFNQSLQQALYGSQGDPSQLGLALSAIFGQQANSAGQNLGSLISGSSQNGANQGALQQLLAALGMGGTAGTGGTGGSDPTTDAILQSILNGGIPGVQTTGSY